MRQGQLTLPATSASSEASPLAVARRVLADAGVTHTELRGERRGEGVVMLLFTLASLSKGKVLEQLADRGLGCTTPAYGTLEVLELRCSTPRVSSAPQPQPAARTVRLSDRTSLDEIYQRVDETFHLTFDFVLTVVIAALVCAVGLVTDQPIFVTASMLLSPLMSPIMAQTLGACVGDRAMVLKGFRNEVAGLALCLLTGSVVGFVCLFTGGVPPAEHESTTLEVMHYKRTDLLIGAVIALPSGAALALAVTSALSDTVVGVAIATSILPPVVGCGINFVLSAHAAAVGAHDEASDRLVAALYGFAMFVINWMCICLGGGLMLRLKQVDGRQLLIRLQERSLPASPVGSRARSLAHEPTNGHAHAHAAAGELGRALLAAAPPDAAGADAPAASAPPRAPPSTPKAAAVEHDAA